METKRVFLLFCWIQIISFDWVQGEVEYKCGKTPKNPTFIVGGDTVVGTWPWMASLGYFDEEEWIHKCGTTLIGKNLFLTAAHCVKDLPPEWQILAGTDDLKLAKTGRFAKVFDIQHVVVHPQFTGNAYFDIAMLRTQHVEFTERISPVCLLNSPSNNEDEYKNNQVDVIGWGSASLTGDTSKSLNRVPVKVYSQSYCNTTHIAGKAIPNYQKNVEISVPRLFQSQVMCAGQSTGMHGSCKGDSGGPLLLENPELESYFQIGIVYGGIAECGSSSFPSIYVRLDDPDIFQFIKIKAQDRYQCGKVPSVLQKRFSEPRDVNVVPWMASLGFFDEEEKWRHQCGTTLIGQNFFLTSANCAKKILPEWQILAGTDDLKFGKRGRYAKVFDIQQMMVHPLFNGNAYFDIALLRTQQVEFTHRITPVCLPTSPSNNEDEYKNDLMDVTGWGSSGGLISLSLKRVSVKVYSQSYCNTTHIAGKKFRNSQINVEISVPRLFQSQVMCAGQSKGEHGFCKGYIGGPLLLENNDLDSYFQIGVVQGGIAECGDRSYPSIFVRLDDPDIFQFIETQTKA